MQNLQQYLKELPKRPGVYFFKDKEGQLLYVGKSTNVYERVKSHLSPSGPKSQLIISEAEKVETIPAEYELEALLVEAELIREHKPKYNSRAKDDKHPLYIKITTGEEFAKTATSRLEDDPGATYFGPFPSSATVRQVLRQTRKIFPFCAQKRIGKKACFYSHLGLCNPCPAQIVRIKDKKKRAELKKTYKENTNNLIKLLSGKTALLKKELENGMKKSAKNQDFEKAILLRDQITKLNYITLAYKPATAYLENPNLLQDIRAEELQELFGILNTKTGLENVPLRIECFDIAHLQGENAAASMVTFVGGEPEKNFYRHFKVRRAKRRDDFAAMSEVIRRRLTHIDAWGKPDLLVVDGGKPQLRAAEDVLQQEQVRLPVIGLAKRLEEVVVLRNNSFELIKLPRNSKALQLLQRLRDEAHRFARSYHLKLRLKSLHKLA